MAGMETLVAPKIHESALPVLLRIEGTVMSEVWISPRKVTEGGIGSQAAPFNGSTPEKLDPVLRSLPPGTVIHWLPGDYLTWGYGDPQRSWKFKPGWRFIGSGITCTELRIVDAVLPGTRYSVIGSDYDGRCDFGEVRDMTLDCDVSGQPGEVCVGGVGIHGSHILVERVRIKRWGTRNGLEAFAAGVSGGHANTGPAEGNVVQDSFAAGPISGMSEIGGTAFVIFGGDEKKFAHHAPAIRRCWVDGTGATKRVRAFGITGAINGLVDGCVARNCSIGYYSDTSFNYGLTIKGCRIHDCDIPIMFNYRDRLETRLIEPSVDILDNQLGISEAGVGARVGISLNGALEGHNSFGHVRAIGNRIYPVGESAGLAGISISKADLVELDNQIEGTIENRILLLGVKRMVRIVDQL